MGSRVNGRAEEKSLREADDGDARWRSHLLGGVVMALTVLPASSTGETLDPAFGSGGVSVATSFPPWRHRLGGSWSLWYASCSHVSRC
jgi:hypothetical protein